MNLGIVAAADMCEVATATQEHAVTWPEVAVAALILVFAAWIGWLLFGR